VDFSIIIEDSKTGFLVPPGDPIALAEKIEILLNDSNQREKMGKNARERVEREYDWEKIVEKHYLPLFKNKKKKP
jgi:glycosyltransferase involved in cell wall biosynthesis